VEPAWTLRSPHHRGYLLNEVRRSSRTSSRPNEITLRSPPHWGYLLNPPPRTASNRAGSRTSVEKPPPERTFWTADLAFPPLLYARKHTSCL
jgi:hypothetical protein